jgi:hypothetical protein
VDGPGTVELEGTEVVGTGGIMVDDVTPVESEMLGPVGGPPSMLLLELE